MQQVRQHEADISQDLSTSVRAPTIVAPYLVQLALPPHHIAHKLVPGSSQHVTSCYSNYHLHTLCNYCFSIQVHLKTVPHHQFARRSLNVPVSKLKHHQGTGDFCQGEQKLVPHLETLNTLENKRNVPDHRSHH